VEKIEEYRDQELEHNGLSYKKCQGAKEYSSESKDKVVNGVPL
jgi:hypothetical protein